MSNAQWGPQPPGWQRGTGPAAPSAPRRRSSAIGWWLAGAAILVAMIVVGVLVIRVLGVGILGTGPTPGSNPTESVCPKRDVESRTPLPAPQDGRVHGGQLSYPILGSPWSAPTPVRHVPFGRNVLTQEVLVEDAYNGRTDWVASVAVGDLVAGDGFFSPQEGSEIVVKCMMDLFYADADVTEAQVTREQKINRATTVDGKEAWLVESHLTFDVPQLKTKGELQIVLIVATSLEASSIFFASIPDTVPQLVQPARDAMKRLKVDA